MPKFGLSTVTVSDADRFWLYVDVRGEDECWPWLGCIDRYNHGRFQIGKISEGAHRVAFLLQHGKIDPNLQVCHNCNNGPCQNGKHLRQDTNTGNMKDKIGSCVYKKGDEHRNSKLTWEMVKYIREVLPRGRYSKEQYEGVADNLGSSWLTVQKVSLGKVWKGS